MSMTRKIASISQLSMGHLCNKKVGIILFGLCVVIFIRVLLNTIVSRGTNLFFIPPSHSKLRFEPWTRDEDISRLDKDRVFPSASYKKIIILSYMRSGSTLAGDLIQSHPDVFYVYEPLLYLWDYYLPNKMDVTQHLRKRTKAFWKAAKLNIVSPLDFMTYMFNCNLTANNLKFLTNTAHSRDFRLGNCPIYKNGMHIVKTSDYCVNTVTKRCFEAKSVLLKVVRLTMAEADRYMERDPDVKVIHLVRDPRGVLLSRMQFNDKETGEMHNNYSNICKRILEDVRLSQTITYKHRGKILTIRYEDLAQNLEGYTRRIFKFIDLPMGHQVLQHLKAITSSQDILPNKKIKAKKTRRKNPYKTAYKWRSVLSFPLVKKIDKACEGLYRIMGYRQFVTDADLRNENVSARSKYYGDGLLTAVL